MVEDKSPEHVMRSHLGRARGLGAAKDGVAHWWGQRVSAIALVPLSLWFLSALLCLAGADYDEVKNWLDSPVTATLTGLFLVGLTYHAILGLRVVIEDYVRFKPCRIAAVLAVQFAGWALAASGIVAVLAIAFGQ